MRTDQEIQDEAGGWNSVQGIETNTALAIIASNQKLLLEVLLDIRSCLIFAHRIESVDVGEKEKCGKLIKCQGDKYPCTREHKHKGNCRAGG